LASARRYAGRDLAGLGAYYTAHVEAMTAERLQSKSDIAAELGHRDQLIDRLFDTLEKLANDPPDELKRTVVGLTKQLQECRHKRAHFLRERDRYRDLYLTELRKHPPKEAHATEETP
jgi:hypothetical protein